MVIVLAVVIPRSITGLRSSIYVAIQLNSSSSKTITVFSFVSNMSANQNLSDQSILLDFRCVLPINGNARSKISDALKAIRYWSSTALCHRELAGLRRDSSTNPFRKYQLRSKASKCKNRGSSILFFQLGIKGAPVLLDKGSTRSLLVCYISST